MSRIVHLLSLCLITFFVSLLMLQSGPPLTYKVNRLPPAKQVESVPV
jgi:hypothetical protein